MTSDFRETYKAVLGKAGGTCYYLTVDVGTVKRKSDTFIHNHHYKHGLINLSFQACYNLSVLTYHSCAKCTCEHMAKVFEQRQFERLPAEADGSRGLS